MLYMMPIAFAMILWFKWAFITVIFIMPTSFIGVMFIEDGIMFYYSLLIFMASFFILAWMIANYIEIMKSNKKLRKVMKHGKSR